MESEGSSRLHKNPTNGSYSEPAESNRHPISLTSILTIYSHQRLCFPRGLLLSGFLTRISHMRHACYIPRPSHSPSYEKGSELQSSVK